MYLLVLKLCNDFIIIGIWIWPRVEICRRWHLSHLTQLVVVREASLGSRLVRSFYRTLGSVHCLKRKEKNKILPKDSTTYVPITAPPPSRYEYSISLNRGMVEATRQQLPCLEASHLGLKIRVLKEELCVEGRWSQRWGMKTGRCQCDKPYWRGEEEEEQRAKLARKTFCVWLVAGSTMTLVVIKY